MDNARDSLAGERQALRAFASGVWQREDGSVMLPMNLHRASIRERLYVIGLGWRACHNVRLTLMMVRQYLRPSAQVCDYEQWRVVGDRK